MKNYDYNSKSVESIVDYAKKLKNKTLAQVCDPEILTHGYSGKGNFGQILEKFYFGYEPNSLAEPDFNEVNMELKASPLKILKNGEYRSKERLVLGIIDYMHVLDETFNKSSFLKKNAHLLLVFYLHDSEKKAIDLLIKLVAEWKLPEEDLEIIRQDWQIINDKIEAGKAHELSEGDTFYLGACTKGSTAEKSFRDQPKSKLKAKQRAYSFKGGYVNHIIAHISGKDTGVYGKLIKSKASLKKQSLEQAVLSKLTNFIGKSAGEIMTEVDGKKYGSKTKHSYALLTKRMLGFKLNERIEEFEKAEIEVKTIRITSTGNIQQSVSFPAFEFEQIYKESWLNSEMKTITEKKFLFLFFREKEGVFCLDKCRFWNMPFNDRIEVRRVWLQTKKVIESGRIFKDYQRNKAGEINYSKKGNPIRYNYFPKMADNDVCHVRPHGTDSTYTFPLPVVEQSLNVKEYSKQCFWLNATYVRDEIYLK